MGEWKAQVSFRIRRDLRLELEEFAAREKRSVGNIGAVLLEWSFQQLKVAGSIDRLLKYAIRPSAFIRSDVEVCSAQEAVHAEECRCADS